jgi:DNA-directed RNA polymerase subunit H (RpoH/RPB5)
MLTNNTVEPIRVEHKDDRYTVTDVYYAFTDKKASTNSWNNSIIKNLNTFVVTNVKSDYEKVKDDIDFKEFCKKRTVIVVTKEIPNDNSINVCSQMFNDPENGIFVQLFYVKQLLFNVMKHKYVPQHTVVTDPLEEKSIRSIYNVKNTREFPIILHTDPVAMYIGLRPQQLCKITRVNETLGNYLMYRFCR